MPYVSQANRQIFDAAIKLLQEKIETPGDLNYVITRIMAVSLAPTNSNTRIMVTSPNTKSNPENQMPVLMPPPPKSKMPPRLAPAPQVQSRPMKTFSVKTWDGAGEGQKVLVYSGSGKGKTTLASMSPKPVFIGLDDGGRMVRNPATGEPIQHIPDIETFQDVRDALHQSGLFATFESVVIDTGTILELLAIQHVLDTIPHEKGGIVKHLDDYGYGKGYNHLFDTMRLIFADLDGLIRQGKNVILLCQQCPVVIANAAGSNYLQDGPKLYSPGPDSKQSFTVRGYACEWADHVFKIDYLQQQVVGARTETDNKGRVKEHAGKIQGVTTRAIFTMPSDPSFFAKTRTLTDPVVSFETAADNSIWRMLFPDAGLPESVKN